jgi:hypothetical protein
MMFASLEANSEILKHNFELNRFSLLNTII